MSTALLSIHPRHVSAIRRHLKLYELRRVIPRREVTRLLIYETAPTSAVVALADVELIVDSPSSLWRRIGWLTGVSHREFTAYTSGRAEIAAMLLRNLRDAPSRDLADYGLRCAPQGWAYVEDEAIA